MTRANDGRSAFILVKTGCLIRTNNNWLIRFTVFNLYSDWVCQSQLVFRRDHPQLIKNHHELTEFYHIFGDICGSSYLGCLLLNDSTEILMSCNINHRWLNMKIASNIIHMQLIQGLGLSGLSSPSAPSATQAILEASLMLSACRCWRSELRPGGHWSHGSHGEDGRVNMGQPLFKHIQS